MSFSDPLLPVEFVSLDDRALGALAAHFERLAAACRQRAVQVRQQAENTRRASLMVARARLTVDVVARLLDERETLPGSLWHAAKITDVPVATVAAWWKDHEQACRKAAKAARARKRRRQGVPPRKRGPLPLPALPAPANDSEKAKDARRLAGVLACQNPDERVTVLTRQARSAQLPPLRYVQPGPRERA